MGERSGKFLLGLVLLFIGGLVLLDQFGIGSGRMMGVLISGAIMFYGAGKILRRSGSRFWGVLIFLFGFLMLVGKLHLLFTSLVAIGVIYLGYQLIRSRETTKEEPPEWERQWARKVLNEDALDRWEKGKKA